MIKKSCSINLEKYIYLNKAWLIISIFIIMLGSGTEIVKAYVLQKIIDSASSINNKLFLQLIIMTVVFIISTTIIKSLQSVLCNKYIQKCLTGLKQDLFNGIVEKDIKNFNSLNSSEYISILSNDVNLIETDYFQNFVLVLEYIITFIFSFIAILKINYIFVTYIMITAWLPVIINKIMSNSLTKRKIEFSDSMAKFIAKIKDILSGFEIIKTFNIQDTMKKEFMILNNRVEDKRFKSKSVNDVCESLSFGSSLLIWLGNLLLGCFLIMKEVLTVGYVLGVSQLLNNIVNPLYRLSFLLNKMKTSRKLMNERLEQVKGGKTDLQIENIQSIPDEIIFTDVSLNINQSKILKNINLTLKKGKKYVIIGESGSGKSSLLKLLMRFYDEEYDGSITIDGVELKTIISKDWYNIISIVQQNVYLFNDSIKNNISLYLNYDKVKINEVINKSCADKFINELPIKVDTIIDESGKNFSGGECQRISIARTLIKNSPILLFDEATSALDNNTAFKIEKMILELKDTTVIAITHKMNEELLDLYDEIIEIRDGSIVL